MKKIVHRRRRERTALGHGRRLEVEWTLPSGRTVRVEDQGGWLIYTDIFVAREYDLQIQEVLQGNSQKDIVPIVDIGANVVYLH